LRFIKRSRRRATALKYYEYTNDLNFHCRLGRKVICTLINVNNNIQLPSFDLNDPSTWACKQVYQSPIYDVSKFQTLINNVIGLNEFNEPIVRLVWAGSLNDCYSKYYTEWDEFGHGTQGELRARYKYMSVLIPGTSDIMDIPPPRWVLEEFHHPGQWLHAAAVTNFKEGKEIRELPETTGYYDHLCTIASHTEACCADAKDKKVVCWGKYRKPAQKDIDRLKRAIYYRNKDAKIDPTKPLDAIAMANIARETEQRKKRIEEMSDNEMRDFVDENAIPLLEAMTGRKFSHKAKAFSINLKEKGIIPYTI